jgi:hypothetical protein
VKSERACVCVCVCAEWRGLLQETHSALQPQPQHAASVQHARTNQLHTPTTPTHTQADVDAAVYLMMANEMIHNLHPEVRG